MPTKLSMQWPITAEILGNPDVFIASSSLISDADSTAPDFKAIVEEVDRLINNAVSYPHGPGELYDVIPSLAHSNANPELDGNIFHEEGVYVASTSTRTRSPHHTPNR